MNAPDDRYGVVLAVGVNDTTVQEGRVRVEPGLAVANLARMVDASRAIGVDVFVVGPPPAGEPAQDARVQALSAQFAQLAADRGVSFAETFAGLRDGADWPREAAAGDGSHPAAGGYAQLAGIVLRAGFLGWAR